MLPYSSCIDSSLASNCRSSCSCRNVRFCFKANDNFGLYLALELDMVVASVAHGLVEGKARFQRLVSFEAVAVVGLSLLSAAVVDSGVVHGSA